MSDVFVVMGSSKDGSGMEVHSRAKPSQVEAIRAAINKSLDELLE
jgi:hypothetical protein